MSKLSPNEPDLALPAWGPYGKRYVGLSHLADADAGHRWDCFLLPGFHRRSVITPYGLREGRWHWRQAAPDLSTYTLRYQLEWQDRVFVDFTVCENCGQDGRLLTADCVNNTKLPQSLDLHLAANLALNPFIAGSVDLPMGGVWQSGLDYRQIEMATAPHRLHQVADARLPGQVLHPQAVYGKAIGGAFFHQSGDAVDYVIRLAAPIADPVLVLRYHRWTQGPAPYRISGLVDVEIDLAEMSAGFATCVVPLGSLEAGEHPIRIAALGGEPLVFEGMAVVSARQQALLRFSSHTPAIEPDAEWDSAGRRLLLRYRGLSCGYAIECLTGELDIHVRRVRGLDVGSVISHRANDFHHTDWRGDGEGFFSVLSLGSLFLAPGERVQVALRVTTVVDQPHGQAIAPHSPADGAVTIQPAVNRFAGFQGIAMLAATTAANVVFPVYHRDKWIRHYTPGRCWDSLYTWDSGMIGLGLAVLDPLRSTDSLAAYLLPEGDPYAAWVEHGTPLPTQAYQFLEIWNRTMDAGLLADAYPRFRQWYELLAGRSRNSTTAKFSSGLLQTWDYFYNSGGWDDYPPQWYLRDHPHLRPRVAPVVTTAHAIRFARILQQMARRLHQNGDVDRYAQDIEHWSRALQAHAWDETSGYFSYVEHDDRGHPVSQMRHASGYNFNCGLDGVSPLLAGGLPDDQIERLIHHLFSSEQLWTPYGLSTVAVTAPYYSDAGYWNGAIWIPHQYLIWKALLDYRQGKRAAQLAKAMLDCWEREANATYHCFEHFRVRGGRGSGWHQFSGLSSPLLAVHAAYHTPGSLTVGFDTWIDSVRWNKALTGFEAHLEVSSPNGATVIICCAANTSPLRLHWNDQQLPLAKGLGNSIYCDLPQGRGVLKAE